mmetsp:Transcript_27627/g.60382  ORF Transcript_27627/g.60382 Transcript_27627/m.60382 type:complete len:311 (-) Transcript_27627:672-1604(-)
MSLLHGRPKADGILNNSLEPLDLGLRLLHLLRLVLRRQTGVIEDTLERRHGMHHSTLHLVLRVLRPCRPTPHAPCKSRFLHLAQVLRLGDVHVRTRGLEISQEKSEGIVKYGAVLIRLEHPEVCMLQQLVQRVEGGGRVVQLCRIRGTCKQSGGLLAQGDQDVQHKSSRQAAWSRILVGPFQVQAATSEGSHADKSAAFHHQFVVDSVDHEVHGHGTPVHGNLPEQPDLPLYALVCVFLHATPVNRKEGCNAFHCPSQQLAGHLLHHHPEWVSWLKPMPQLRVFAVTVPRKYRHRFELIRERMEVLGADH